MTLVICEDKYPLCGGTMVKDVDCNGDYYYTIMGLVRQRFCFVCGSMLPLVSEREPEFISNNTKKRILGHIASIKKKRFREYTSIYHNRLKNINDKKMFARACSIETQVPLETVTSFLD